MNSVTAGLRSLPAVAALWLIACGGPQGNAPPVQSVVETLSSTDTQGYQRAMAPTPFAFPRDHGAHPGFKSEWWYFTGNLSTADERRFGFQFTLFRFAVAPEPPVSASAWATNQAYMAHFAVTDVDGDGFYHDERVARGALGLAGVDSAPFRAWLEDWRVTADGAEPARGCDGCLSLRVTAASDAAAIALSLTSTKPAVRHGDNGLSQKSATPGNASYYYSLTRMATTGTLRVGGETHVVSGLSWFDHEWSTSALEAGQTGWDWFSLQLSGAAELMLYRFRNRDAALAEFASGSYVDPDGGVTRLHPGDFAIEVLDAWTSPVSGVAYPAKWRIRVPRRALELEVTPRLPRQEMNTTFRYWEGSVSATGREAGRPVSGTGYVELTGYQ